MKLVEMSDYWLLMWSGYPHHDPEPADMPTPPRAVWSPLPDWERYPDKGNR